MSYLGDSLFIVTLATMTIIDGLRYGMHGPGTFQGYSPGSLPTIRGNGLYKSAGDIEGYKNFHSVARQGGPYTGTPCG